MAQGKQQLKFERNLCHRSWGKWNMDDGQMTDRMDDGQIPIPLPLLTQSSIAENGSSVVIFTELFQ